MKLMEIKGEIVLLNLLDDCNPVATETGICGNGAKRQAKASQILKRRDSALAKNLLSSTRSQGMIGEKSCTSAKSQDALKNLHADDCDRRKCSTELSIPSTLSPNNRTHHSTRNLNCNKESSGQSESNKILPESSTSTILNGHK